MTPQASNPSRHLDDARLLALGSGEAMEPKEQEHLASCPVCRADVQAFGQALHSARPVAVSSFHAARAERSLLRALDEQLRERRRAWRPAAVMAAVLASAASGAVAASLVLTAPAGPAAPHQGPPLPVASASGVAAPAPVPTPQVATVSAPAPTPTAAPVLLPLPMAPSPRLTAFARVSDAQRAGEAVARGDGVLAARIWLAALERGAPVQDELSRVLDRFPGALVEVDADLLRAGSAFTLRLRCERGLLARRDRHTVDACREFARRFPDDGAVRTLSFAAGRLAEDELEDLALAEEEYDRTLLLSPFSGIPATDVLLARARVRTRRGNLDEARADLRLYLAKEPAARHDAAVSVLMGTLGITPESTDASADVGR